VPQIQADTLVAGRYRLESRLDAGGRAQVWQATDTELNRLVAVKIIVTPSGGDPAFVDAFRAEAQLEARLKHPSIVEVLDWGHDEEANFVVMELVAGQSIGALLANGPLASDRVLNAGRQLASALTYAHAEGVAHGSIGPAHALMDSDGRAVLIDFGLQCREQCEYPPFPDSDTYALGVLLYEMLTGANPMGPRPAGIPDSERWPEHPHKLNHEAPTALDHIVMKAIAADPAERYHGAAELQQALDDLARPKSRAWLWVALVVLALAFVGVGTWYFASQQMVVVPDVTGMPSAQAQSAITSAELKFVSTGQVPSGSIASGNVVSEDPTAGTRVRRGSQVGVTVSTGKPVAAAPSVTGLDLQNASDQIVSAGLVVGKVTSKTDPTFPANTVISQSPTAGAEVVAGSAVDLVLSAGKAMVTVPDVRGMTQDAATTKLQGLKMVVDVATTYSTQPKGVVINQGPAAGTNVPAGSTVTLSVSKGATPVKVPDVTGAQAADAKKSLHDVGLVPVSTVESGTASQVGTVISQNPDAGVSLAPGSQVKIVIGK
jgi:eukaryotic-like serine/threonine-protein kinase